MWEGRLKYHLIIVTIFSITMCRKPYDPPAIKANNHFLAVDGVINTGPFSSTSITLTRSLNLLDTVTDIPELNAHVLIQNASGAVFPLTDTGANGVYVSVPLNLDPSQKYQLSITTSDGNKYLSDLVTPKTAPPIDSLTFQIVNDPVTADQALTVYVNAHDPTNNTRYYRWQYIETWQHQSIYQTFWGLRNDSIYFLGPGESTYNCWSTGNSKSILLGSSVNLSADVISQVPIATFHQNDPKMDVRYSMLVRQYPLDFEAYNYWLTIQKNSQTLGGLFDPQPAQITGNMHSITNPASPVLGYISASSVQEKRFFVGPLGWQSNPLTYCPFDTIPVNPVNELIYTYPDTSFALYYFISSFPAVMLLTRKECLDCRYQGGTNIQPPYWQ
jgi:hypothetical protein